MEMTIFLTFSDSYLSRDNWYSQFITLITNHIFNEKVRFNP
jgi:hypothetical protein